jgi:regulatory protein
VPSLRKRAPKRLPAAQLPDAAAAERVAVGLLARRDYASGELAGKLGERGFASPVIEPLLEELRARRLLDDERYAGHFVQYHVRRGQGPLRIRRELGEAGVGAALIDAALASVSDWAEIACQVRRRRFGARAPASWPEKGRQARFLQYRGFSNDHIRSALGPDFDPDS